MNMEKLAQLVDPQRLLEHYEVRYQNAHTGECQTEGVLLSRIQVSSLHVTIYISTDDPSGNLNAPVAGFEPQSKFMQSLDRPLVQGDALLDDLWDDEEDPKVEVETLLSSPNEKYNLEALLWFGPVGWLSFQRTETSSGRSIFAN